MEIAKILWPKKADNYGGDLITKTSKMTTKDCSLFSSNVKYQPSGTKNAVSNSTTQYSNLNLNENQKRSNYKSIQPKFCTEFLQKGETAVFLAQASEQWNNYEQENKNAWMNNKSQKGFSFAAKKFQYSNISSDFSESNESKSGEKSLKSNSSTLSLHIAAYENSFEFKNDSQYKTKPVEKVSKAWKNAKISFSSSPSMTSCFEFPRQQENSPSSTPGIMQFKASQKLLNPSVSGSGTSADDVNNNATVNTPQFVKLDQKFICFDVEQVLDAKQKLQIGRVEGNKRVAWRIRTNAPTRYIVNPNGGVLDDACPSQSLTVELVGNRYNPHHKLVVQAIQILDSESPKNIWKSQRAKDHEYVQTINLELSTTLMNLEFTQQMCNDRASKSSASLASLLDQSSTAGPDRVQELEHLYALLKSDTEKMQLNVEKTLKLKEVLESHLETRKQQIKDLSGKIEENENRISHLNAKIKSQESALSEVQARNKMNDNKDCSIM